MIPTIIFTVYCISTILWISYWTYIYFRIEKVSKLRIFVLDLEAAYYRDNPDRLLTETWYKRYDSLPEYDKMLFSFKPLKLQNYLDEKSIKELEPYI